MAETQLILETLVKGTAEARKALGTVTTGVNDLGKVVKDNAEGFRNLGIVAGATFAGIIVTMNKTIDSATKQQNALIGLKSVVEGTGNNFEDAEKFIQGYIADGLVPMGDASTSLKNLLSSGLGLDEAATIMNRFKDSAAFGRQASLNLGDAIKGATEGLKNENSILVDNAGVTKNVSVMWKEYADKLGVGVGSLTTAQKRQAELNGIVEETRFQVGDAAKLSDSYAGATARATKAQSDLAVAMGTAFQPAKEAFYNAITPILVGLTDWVKKNPELVASVTLVVGAIAGLIAMLVGIGAAVGPVISGAKAIVAGWGLLTTAWGYLTTVAVPALITALGAISAPVWIVIGVIAALIAIGVALWKNWDKVKEFLSITWEEIKILFNDSLLFISELWTTVWGAISTFFSELWASIIGALSSAWGIIKGLVSAGMKWLSDTFNLLAEPIKVAWGNMWETMSGTVTSVWDTVKNTIVSSMNWIIDKINFVITMANKVAKMGASSIGLKIVSLPTIPRLANGGIVKARPGGILANIGEGGQDEAVIPLNKMKNMGMGGGVTINITGTFGKGAAEEIGDYIFTQLKRASYI